MDCLTGVLVCDISTHAPARGATNLDGKTENAGDKFQPTLPHGERLDLCELYSKTSPISTHAPARGATSAGDVRGNREKVSFQPTLPHGERLTREAYKTLTAAISTHAPARGATTCARVMGRIPDISTHAPARGATKRGIQPL